jgi:hypothetical protein
MGGDAIWQERSGFVHVLAELNGLILFSFLKREKGDGNSPLPLAGEGRGRG